MAYLDKTGLSYFWSTIKSQLSNKSDKGHTHTVDEISGADTVDGYHIVVSSSEPTTNDSSVITFVLEG